MANVARNLIYLLTPHCACAFARHPALLHPHRPRCLVPSISLFAVAAARGGARLGGAMASDRCSGLYASGCAQYRGRWAGIDPIRPCNALRFCPLQRGAVLLGLSPPAAISNRRIGANRAAT